MWHFLHLIARPIEVLLGLFCVLTAIVLYPNEEGKIQSKFEDFWIRVDDYRQLALSRHATFMTQVAQLETGFLNRVFGPKLVSAQALGVSFSCSLFAVGVTGIVLKPVTFGMVLLAVSVIVGALSIYLRKRRFVQLIVIVAAFVFLALYIIERHPDARTAATHTIFEMFGIGLGSFACDVFFVIVTRRMLRWAGQMRSSLIVLATIFLNLLLALTLIFPMIAIGYVLDAGGRNPDITWRLALSSILLFVAFSNIFDALLALLFVQLAILLLIHRAVWPLLTRTLFRMQDIGTKGRRAILTTVGLALLAAGVTGKVPDLLQKLIEKLGG